MSENKHKLPETKIYNLYTDICVPDKTHQKFVEKFRDKETQLIYYSSEEALNVSKNEEGIDVQYINETDGKETLNVDMVILATAMVPGKDVGELSKIAQIDLDENGFFLSDKV